MMISSARRISPARKPAKKRLKVP